MAKEGTAISYVEAERPPTAQELALWKRAEQIARRVNLMSYVMKLQWKNIKLTHEFAKKNSIDLGEPDLPDFADRMFAALNKIESLKDAMCKVNQLDLGIRMTADGKDLDIVQPKESGFGWVIPAIGISLIVAGAIKLWLELENEVDEISDKYNGVLEHSDKELCKDPTSKTCKDWKASKNANDYHKRESIIDSVKNALVSAGGVAKKGLGWGIALAIPLLIMMYAPTRR